MIVYIENPIVSTKKLLDLISEFSKIADTKSIFRNQLHFYAPTMKYQKEKLRKKSHLLQQQEKIKYLGINLTKEVKTCRNGKTTEH